MENIDNRCAEAEDPTPNSLDALMETETWQHAIAVSKRLSELSPHYDALDKVILMPSS